MTSGKPTWRNGSTLTKNARDVGLTPTLGTVFPIFSAPMTLVVVSMILYKLHAVRLLNLPCVCICKAIACIYVTVSIKRLTIPGGWV